MIDRSRFGLNRIISPYLDLAEFFQLTKDLGFRGVELRNDLSGNDILDSYTPREIRKLAQRHHVEICSINALQQFNCLERVNKIKQELHFLLSLAKDTNCLAIVLCPYTERGSLVDPKKLFQETTYILKDLRPLFEEAKIMGYIEPLGFTSSSLPSVVLAMEAIREVGYEGYKIVYDTFHHSLGPDNLDTLEMRYDIQLTGLVHLSSVTEDVPRNLYRDEYRNIDFAKDRLNSKEQIDFLLKKGYQGMIFFEPFAEEVQRLNKEELKRQINQAIDFLNFS